MIPHIIVHPPQDFINRIRAISNRDDWEMSADIWWMPTDQWLSAKTTFADGSTLSIYVAMTDQEGILAVQDSCPDEASFSVAKMLTSFHPLCSRMKPTTYTDIAKFAEVCKTIESAKNMSPKDCLKLVIDARARYFGERLPSDSVLLDPVMFAGMDYHDISDYFHTAYVSAVLIKTLAKLAMLS